MSPGRGTTRNGAAGPLVERQYANFGADRYMALDVPAFVAGKECLLACSKNEDPEQRRVIVLMPQEARWLWNEGRLEGWSPFR